MRAVCTLVACLAAGIGLWAFTASGQAGAGPAPTAKEPAGVKVVPVAVSETRYKSLAGGGKGTGHTELKMTVHVVGGAASEAVQFGHVKITQATDEKGNSLLIAAKERRQPHHCEKGYVTITKWWQDQRKNGFQADFIRLKPAARAAAKIARITGSLKLLTGGKVTAVTIPNARSLVGIELQHPALKAAGVKIKIVRPEPSGTALGDPSKTMVFQIEGKVEAILATIMVDASGNTVRCLSGFDTVAGGIKRLSLTVRSKLPDKAGLKLAVLSDAKVVTVPFELKDVPLP